MAEMFGILGTFDMAPMTCVLQQTSIHMHNTGEIYE